MLNAIKRWISGGAPGSDWSGVDEWARRQGHGFKRAKDDEGFVIEGSFEQRPWRLEWGPPQRWYIPTHELRLRIEMQLPSGLQMLLMSRPLVEMLERETFERYTESNQTIIDVSTPEEMRWLAMFPKVDIELPKSVKPHFAAVASQPASAQAWLDTPFGLQLAQASLNLLRERPAFVLMTLRGRVYMRLQLDEPDTVAIGQAIALFQAGAASALRVAGGVHEPERADVPAASTAWTDIQPEEPKDRNRK